MKRFDDRVAIVTGAGGDIGAATAVRLAKEGASLAVFDRNVDLLNDTVSRCQDEGAKVVALAVDQTSREQVEQGVAEALAVFGQLDVLFGNAGYGKFSTFLDQPIKEWQRHVDVNLTGTFHLAQVVARTMVKARRGGAIVLNASSGAQQHSDLLSAYCATKAAIRMLATGMASELGSHRIRVNSVMPGVIETAMTAPMLESDPRHRDVLLSETPVGRLGTAEDVAALVAFLASDEAAFITGQAHMIDGGQTIHGHPRWFRTDYRQSNVDEWVVAP